MPGSLGMYGDPDEEDDYSQGQEFPETATDRASTSIQSPNFQLPREDDSTASEADRTPTDDNAPKPTPQPQQPLRAVIPGADQLQPAIDAASQPQQPAQIVHQAWADPGMERQQEAQDQATEAQQNEQMGRQRAGLYQYLRQNGVQTTYDENGQERVQTDEQGNPVFQPVSSHPFQDDDGRWVRQQRDSSGRLSNIDLLDSGNYRTDPKTGDQYIPDGMGGRQVIGQDQQVVARQKILATQRDATLQNQADEVTVGQLKNAIQPIQAQMKQWQGTTIGDTGQTLKQTMQQAAGDPNDAATQQAQDALSKWQAAHPEYGQAKAGLDAATQRIQQVQAAILDRKAAALSLSLSTGRAPALSLVAPPSYQDPASPNMPPGQTTADHIQANAATAAAQTGSTQAQALIPSFQRLKALGIDVPAIDPNLQKAQQQVQAAQTGQSGDSAWDAAKDFGARVFGTAGADINKALQAGADLLGSKDWAQFFKENADISSHLSNPKNDNTVASQVAGALGHVLATVPTAIITEAAAPEAIGAGAVELLAKAGRIAWNAIPMAVQFAGTAAADAKNQAIASGKSEDEANAAAGSSALDTLKQLPAYLIGGQVAGAIERPILKLISSNPALVNPLLRGAVHFGINTLTNMGVSGGLRVSQGGNFLPNREQLIGDAAWAAQSAIHTGYEQHDVLKQVAAAKTVEDGSHPQLQALVKTAADPNVSDNIRAMASTQAEVMRRNANDLLTSVGAKQAAPGSTGPQPGDEREYRDNLTALDAAQRRYSAAGDAYDGATDDGTKASAQRLQSQAVDDATDAQTRLHQIARDRIDGIDEAQRTKLGKIVDTSIDVPSVEQSLRDNADTAFGAQSIGSDPAVREAYVTPEKEAAISKLTGGDPVQQALVDRHVGMLAGRDLFDVARGRPIEQPKAEALENAGLLTRVDDGAGGTVMKVNDNAFRLLTKSQQDAIKNAPDRFNVQASAGTPQVVFATHVKQGMQRGVLMFGKGATEPVKTPRVVSVTSTAPGEASPSEKRIPVKAASEPEAVARAVAAAEKNGHSVHDAAPSEPEHPNFKTAKAPDFTPEGRKALSQVKSQFDRNAKLFKALGVDAPRFVKFSDRDLSGIAVHQGKLLLDGDLLAREFAGLGGKASEWARNALVEEVIHLASQRGAGAEYEQLYGQIVHDPNLDPTLLQMARDAYGPGFDKLPDSGKAAEVVRMVVQRRWTGTITERIRDAVQRVVDYLKGIKIDGGSELLRRAVQQTEAVLNEARAKSEPETPHEPTDTNPLRTGAETSQPVGAPPETSAEPGGETGTGKRGSDASGGEQVDQSGGNTDSRSGEYPEHLPAGSAAEHDAAIEAHRQESEALHAAGVVNEAMWFHGSPHLAKGGRISRFEIDPRLNSLFVGKGAYFTDSRKIAQTYTHNRDDIMSGAPVEPETVPRNTPYISARLNVKHPFDADNGWDQVKKVLAKEAPEAAKLPPWVKRQHPEVKEPTPKEYWNEEVDRNEENYKGPRGAYTYLRTNLQDWRKLDNTSLNDELPDILKKHGFDGIKYEGGHALGGALKHNVMVAWDPEQVNIAGHHGDQFELQPAASTSDYEREAQNVIRGGGSVKPKIPTDEERFSLVQSYQDAVRKSGFPAVPIADVAEGAGLPLNDDSKSAILGMYRTGDIVAMPTGDFSLSDNRRRAWGIRGGGQADHTPSLMLRMKKELQPRDSIQPAASTRDQFSPDPENVTRLRQEQADLKDAAAIRERALDAWATGDQISTNEAIRRHEEEAGRPMSDNAKRWAKSSSDEIEGHRTMVERNLKAAETIARVGDAFKALASHDEAFQFPKDITGKTPEEVARQLSVEGREVFGQQLTPDRIRFSTSRGQIEVVRMKGKDWQIAALPAGSQGVFHGGGTSMYQSAFAWAHNNGFRLVAEHLSDVNELRRTSNMISSALRFGATEHMVPGKEQKVPWTGSESKRLGELLQREAALTVGKVPELANLTIDPETLKVVDHAGHQIPDRQIDQWIRERDPERLGGVGIGAILTRSAAALSEVGEIPGGFAEHLFRRSGGQDLGALEGSLYAARPTEGKAADGEEKGPVPAVTHSPKEVMDAIKAIAEPTSLSKPARDTGLTIRENAAELDARMNRAAAVTNAARKDFAKMTSQQRLDFIDNMEHGRTQATPYLDSIAKTIRQMLDDRRQDVQALGTGALQKWVDNYFPHIWQDPKAAQNWLQRTFSKRPLEGSRSFLKQRTVPTIADGIAAGLKPASDNPVDLALLKAHEMDRYITAHRILNEMKARGLAKFVKATERAPDGYKPIDDRIATVPGPPEGQGLSQQFRQQHGVQESYINARTIRGQYYAPEDAARVINNYLSPGLAGNVLYDAIRGTGNAMNQFQLGFSAFHAGAETINSSVSSAALGLKQVLEGDIAGGFKNLASTPVSAYQDVAKGSKVLKEMMAPGTQGSDIAKLADAVVAAGGRGRTDPQYQIGAIKSFKDAWENGQKGAALLKAPFAALEAFTHPLMNWFVPRMKLGAFARLAEYELGKLPPGADRMAQREVLARAWDSIDNRFGQMVYDNLFWNKNVKDMAMIGTRSVGWNWGTIRELGGGLKDAATVWQRAGTGNTMTHRMAYTFALPAVVGLMGAVYQYLHTGKGPESVTDYFNPRTGHTLPDGTDERVNFPSYMKDVRSYLTHPIQTVLNKVHPLISMIAEMVQNKDFYGTEIVHPDDPLWRRVAQEGKFVGSNFIPFSLSGGKKRQGGGAEAKAENMVGITPAPAETIRTPAMQAIADYHAGAGSQVRTQEQAEQAQLRHQIIDHLRTKDIAPAEAFQQAVAAGYQMTAEKRREIMRQAAADPKAWAFERLPEDVAENVFKKANPEERKIWAPLLTAKRASAARRGTLAVK